MCDPSRAFRLCTCSGNGPIDWRLERPVPDAPNCYVLGKSIGLLTSDEAELDALLMADVLDQGDCFDFPYLPQDGDVLHLLNLGTYGFEFHYLDERWNPVHERGPDELRVNTLDVGQLQPTEELGLDADPMWLRLLASPYDAATRDEAARWFHGHGRPALANWMEQESLAHRGEPASDLFDARRLVSTRVQALLARTPVALCPRNRCAKAWQTLEPTSNPQVRRCDRCKKRWTFTSRPQRSGNVVWVATQ